MSKFKIGDSVVIKSNKKKMLMYNNMRSIIKMIISEGDSHISYYVDGLLFGISEADLELVSDLIDVSLDAEPEALAVSATDLLNQGKSILEQRGSEYETTTGAGERSFASVAVAFSAITGKHITPAEVCLMLQIVKDVRQWSQDRLHEDSVVDGVNYAALKGEELYKQYGVKND